MVMRWAVVLVLLLGTAGCDSTTSSFAPQSARTVAHSTSRSATRPSLRLPHRTLRVVGLGDSVMVGTNCECPGIVPEYAAALATRTRQHVTSTNLALNGKVTSEVLDDLRGDATTQRTVSRADLVLVTIGANDLLPQLEEWQASTCDAACYTGPVQQMGAELGRVLDAVESLRGGRRDGVLVTDYWNVFTDGDVAVRSGGAEQVDWSEDVTAAANRAICQAAKSHGAVCVDLVSPFKGAFRGPQQTDPTDLLAPDGDHPNAAGVADIVRSLINATDTR